MTTKESAQPDDETTRTTRPSPSPNCALTTPDLHRLTLWWSPAPFETNRRGHSTQWGRKRVITSGMISKEGQHLGDKVLAVPSCDKPIEGHHLRDEGRLRPPGVSV